MSQVSLVNILTILIGFKNMPGNIAISIILYCLLACGFIESTGLKIFEWSSYGNFLKDTFRIPLYGCVFTLFLFRNNFIMTKQVEEQY